MVSDLSDGQVFLACQNGECRHLPIGICRFGRAPSGTQYIPRGRVRQSANAIWAGSLAGYALVAADGGNIRVFIGLGKMATAGIHAVNA